MDASLIETMPLGEIEADRSDQYLPLTKVRAALERRWTLDAVADRSCGPARYVRVAETGGRLGFITPMTNNFCAGCNRVRLTATGTLYLCLGHDEQADLRTPLRDRRVGRRARRDHRRGHRAQAREARFPHRAGQRAGAGAADVEDRRVSVVPGGRIDPSLDFRPLLIAVLTVSDTRDEAERHVGRNPRRAHPDAGHTLAARAIVPDDIAAIRGQVKQWIGSDEVDVILTTGGTGLTGRDVTPEAIEPLFDKRIEGFSAVFHLVSYQSVGLSTIQSRATAGIVDGVFVFCLPGSNGAVKDGWDKVIGPQLDSRHRPCNLVELMPRLSEALMAGLTHVDGEGRARMVDVSDKARHACAPRSRRDRSRWRPRRWSWRSAARPPRARSRGSPSSPE